jgi:hypothetical protein
MHFSIWNDITLSNFIASLDEGNKCRKKAKMLATVAARLCRDVCLSYDMLVVANERLQTTHHLVQIEGLSADALLRNQT